MDGSASPERLPGGSESDEMTPDPETQAQLGDLASDVEDRQRAMEVVDEAPTETLAETIEYIVDQFTEISRTILDTLNEMLAPIFGENFLRSGDWEESDGAAESREPVDVDESLLTSRTLSEAELSGLNENERIYAEIIAQGGLPPERIIALHQHNMCRRVSREELFKFVSDNVEAIMAVDGPMDIMLPVMIATIMMESSFRPDLINSTSGATGTFQHLPRYWAGSVDRSRDLLIGANVISGNETDDEIDQLIFNNRAQTYVTANRYMRNFNLISNGMTMRNYPEHTIARDLYLMHNSGQAHRWVIGFLNGEISRSEFDELYENRVQRGNNWYTQDGRRFENYAYARATEEVSTQSWNKVQGWYYEVKEILYGRG